MGPSRARASRSKAGRHLGVRLRAVRDAHRLAAPCDGEDVSETLAAVLRQEMEWKRLPPGTPPAIRRLLRRCLVRDARLRLPDIGVARLEIDEAAAEPSAAETPQTTDRRLALPLLTVGFLGLVLGGAAMFGWLQSTPASNSEPRVLQVVSGERISYPRISPDGHHALFLRDGRLVVALRLPTPWIEPSTGPTAPPTRRGPLTAP